MPVAIKSLIKKGVPDSKMRTGIKISKIMCGLSVSMIAVDYPIGPKLSLK
jgi:hypothetical protein